MIGESQTYALARHRGRGARGRISGRQGLRGLDTNLAPPDQLGHALPMDWFLGAADQISDFRRERAPCLSRHGASGCDGAIADAKLASEALGNAMRHTGGP